MPTIVALDLEAGSLKMRVGLGGYIISVGMVAIDGDTGQVILKRRFVIPPCRRHDQQYVHAEGVLHRDIRPDIGAFIDPEIYANFWSKHLDVLLQLQRELPANTTARQVWNMIAAQLRYVFETCVDVVLVSDCPDFDIGVLNDRLAVHVPWVPAFGVRYMGGSRVMVRNPRSELVGFPREVRARLKSGVRHVGITHFPDDDALNAGMLQALIIAEIDRQK